MIDTTELLTAQELANAFKCSLAAVRKWTAEGLPCEHIGRLRRYALRSSLEWCQQREAARLERKRNQTA
jgi:phage terminase Nu1 subunit (DNA packaging protein)